MSEYLNKTGFKHVWAGIKSRLANKVDVTRKINGKPLTSDITLNAIDIGVDTTGIVNQAKAYTDTEVADALREAKAYTDANAGSGGGGAPVVDNSNHQFSISGSNLETGWYKIGTTKGLLGACLIHIYDMGYNDDPFTTYEVDATIQLRNTDMYCYSEPSFPKLLSGSVDFYTEETDEFGDHLTDFTYNGFTRLGVKPIYDEGIQEWYIYYNNPGYQVQFSTITITNLTSGDITVVMGEETASIDCGLCPCTDTLSDPVEGTGHSYMNLNIHDTRMEDRMVDQFTVHGDINESGWYEVAVSDYERPMGLCTINITDRCWSADNVNLSCRIVCDTLHYSDIRMKVLSCTVDENYVGIDKVRIIHNYYTGDDCLEVHINNDEWHDISVTIENNTPYQYWGDKPCQWLPAKFESVEGADPSVRKPIYTFTPDFKDTMPATTADLEGLGGGSVSDEALAETLGEAKAYTDTEVADALREAKAYTDANASSGTDTDAILAELKAYVDTEVAKALEEAKKYTDAAIGTVIEAVEEHNSAMIERIDLLEANIATTTGVLPVEGVEF